MIPQPSAVKAEKESEPTLATHGGCCPFCGYEMSAYQWSNHTNCPKCSAPTTPDTANKYPSEALIAEWSREFYRTDGRPTYDADVSMAFQIRKACDWQAHQCREQVARWMLAKGYATGHGDTIKDLLTELVGEVRERDALNNKGAIRHPQAPNATEGGK